MASRDSTSTPSFPTGGVRDARKDVLQVHPASDDSGVDLTLIREYLRLTPLERLRSLQNAVRAIAKFRSVGKKTFG